MNNFLFENKTKVYFGKGGVKEYLGCLLEHYGDTVMLAYGGGSIKHNGVYAVYFRLRSLYAVLPGVDAVFDFAGGRVWLLPAHHRRNSHCRSRGMVQWLDC